MLQPTAAHLGRVEEGSDLPVIPRGSIYATVMESSLQNHDSDGFLGLDSRMVVSLELLGLPKRVVYRLLLFRGTKL